jgi:hypothetical protein
VVGERGRPHPARVRYASQVGELGTAEDVPGGPPVDQVRRVVHGDAGEPLEARGGEVVVPADPHQARIRVKSGQHGVADVTCRHAALPFVGAEGNRRDSDFARRCSACRAAGFRNFPSCRQPLPRGFTPAWRGLNVGSACCQVNLSAGRRHRFEIFAAEAGERGFAWFDRQGRQGPRWP